MPQRKLRPAQWLDVKEIVGIAEARHDDDDASIVQTADEWRFGQIEPEPTLQVENRILPRAMPALFKRLIRNHEGDDAISCKLGYSTTTRSLRTDPVGPLSHGELR